MNFNLDNYLLKSNSFLDFLSPDEKLMLVPRLIRKEYSKNEVIFKEGSTSKGVYILKKGKVKIFQTNNEGKQSIVYIYKKGDYFGYRPILADEIHPVSAVALDKVVITFIPKDIFLSLLKKSPALANKLLISLSKEFNVWINKMTTFSQYGVKERVALSLLILNAVYQHSADTNKPVTIALNRDDFAGFVGTAKETLVRTLRVFKDDKIIATKGTKIILKKQKTLFDILRSSI